MKKQAMNHLRKSKQWLACLILFVSLLFTPKFLSAQGDPNLYIKTTGDTLTAEEWNQLNWDFVRKNLETGQQLSGFFSINTTPDANYKLDISGALRATTLSGSYLGTLNAANISSGIFGANTGGGHYSFSGNLGVGTSTATERVHVVDGGILIQNAAGQDAVRLLGRAGGTANHVGTITTDTLNANRTYTLPDASVTLVGQSNDETISGLKTFSHASGMRISNADGSLNFTAATGNVKQITTTFGHLALMPAANVGIGTTTPSATLDVIGTGSFSQPVIVGTPALDNHATTKSYVDSTVSSGIGGIGDYWVLSGSNLSASSTSWNVGIGTTTTGTYKLNVQGDINFTGNLLNNGSPFVGSRWGLNGTAIYYNTGNVGIGTTSPAAALHVANNALIGGTSTPYAGEYIFNVIAKTGASDRGFAIIMPGLPVSSNSRQAFAVGITGETFSRVNFLSDGTFGIGSGSAPRDTFIGRSAANTFRIGSTYDLTGNANLLINGNVGIGTTSPAFNLQVIGTGSFSQPVVVGAPALDQHAATKNYVDTTVASGIGGVGDYWVLSGSNLSASSTSWNVGIGTTTPTQQLEITKNFKMPVTNGATQGVIYRANDRFIHTQGTNNQFFGVNAGNFTLTGSVNLGVGGESLLSLTSGSDNTAFGHGALRTNSSGIKNTAIGRSALRNSTGGLNTAVGWEALVTNTTGFQNTAVGEEALYNSNTGNNNTALGYFAGSHTSNGIGLLTPSSSVYIGANTRGGDSSSETNAIVIGTDAIGLGSNTIVLGNDSIVTTALKGNVGIGTTSPAFKLNVIGTGSFSQPVVVGAPALDEHAATKNYVDSTVASGIGGVGDYWILSGNNLTASSTNWNVGIGTTAPLEKLHINEGNIYVYDGEETARAGGAISFGIKNTTDEPMSSIKGIYLDKATNRLSGGIEFFTRPSGSGMPLTSRMVIASNGYVGVGNFSTSDPEASFHVKVSSPGYTGLIENSFGWAAGSNGLKVAVKRVNEDTTIQDWLADGVNVMSLISTGRLGIGTTTPAFNLQVIGTGSFSQPIVVGAPALDEHAATKSYVDSTVSSGIGGIGDYWVLSGNNLTASSTNWNVGIGTTTPTQQLELTASFRTPVTTSATTGVWYKGTNSFIHNYAPSGSNGNNTFVGVLSGNFTSTFSTGHDSSRNTALGASALSSLTTGHSNTAIGMNAGVIMTSGTFNNIIGGFAGNKLTTGSNNNLQGWYAGGEITSGGANTIIGESALRYNATGSGNTAIGWRSLFSTSGTNISASIGIGYASGMYETGSNKLFIDALDRGTEARGRTESLIYGVMSSTLANQILSLGGGGNVGIGTTSPTFNLQVIGTGSFSQPIVVGAPALDEHAATKSYVDSTVSSGIGGLDNYWVLSGNSLTASSTNWSVGIGTTSPDTNYILDVVGTARFDELQMASSTSVLNMALGDIQGVGKLTVQTIDPLYRIKGINYSTFAPSIVGGVKEEYVGRGKISKLNKNGEYELVIDFKQQSLGSDLWVWHQVVDFAKERVEVLITPYGRFAQTYYLIDQHKLIFRSDRPVEVSYRLIGHRHDWRSWPTRAVDQQETPSFIIN